jgi:hypothetical protein
MGAEPDGLTRRVRISADRLPVWIQAFQHAHGLKEVESVSFLEESII